MDLKLPGESLSTFLLTFALLTGPMAAGAVTLQSEPDPILEMRPAGPVAGGTDTGPIYPRIDPQNIQVTRPGRPEPPGMLVRMSAPAVDVPRSLLPPVHAVPIGPTAVLYGSAWFTCSGLITAFSLRQRRPYVPWRLRPRRRDWPRALRRRLPDLSWLTRYSRPGPWPGYRASRSSSPSKL